MSGTTDFGDREEPVFEKSFAGRPGDVAQLSDRLRRVLAPNPSPFTFHGTNSYVVGRGTVAIVDPGPDDPAHVAALLEAVRGETVSHIVLTHTHIDHAPASRALAAATGARIVGCAPYAPAFGGDGALQLDASHDPDYAPSRILVEGDAVEGPDWTLVALQTPGHAANHLCYVLREENALLSGDHVMAWSTSIVAPPDGVMADYMASLEKLRGRAESIYWPGHGGPVTEPQRFVRGLVAHRRQRERAILKRLADGDRAIAEIVPALYAGVSPVLHPAAARSVFAHLIDLVGRGLVATDGAPRIDGAYRVA